jgi:hypothetical protein
MDPVARNVVTWISLALIALIVCFALPPIALPPSVSKLDALAPILGGTLAGMRSDPVRVLALFGFGLLWNRPWWSAGFALLVTVVVAAMSWSWQDQLGIPVEQRLPRVVYSAAAYFIAGFAVACLVGLVMHFRRGAVPKT